MKLFKTISVLISKNFQFESEYRLNFLFSIFNVVVSLFTSIIVIFIFFQSTNSINGWNMYEFFVLLGIFRLIKGILNMWIIPSLSKVQEYINDGTLDFILLKPVDSQLYLSFSNYNLWSLSEVILGNVMLFFGLYKLQLLSINYIILGYFSLIIGIVMLYNIILILMTTSFWLIKTRNLLQLINIIMDFNQYPASIYPKIIKFFLLYIFPVFFAVNIPASVFINKSTYTNIIIGIIICVLTTVISRLFWKKGVEFYESASS